MSGIFEMGFREFARLRQSGAPSDQLLEGARRAMRVAQIKEMDRLEHNLGLLATIGSVSPYVGLFGTVWGIMGTFVSLGGVQQATLATVAPGIAEALVATAFALVAAIPAFIAYNRYAEKVGAPGASLRRFHGRVFHHPATACRSSRSRHRGPVMNTAPAQAAL